MKQIAFLFAVLCAARAAGADENTVAPETAIDHLLDRIAARESALLDSVRTRTPLIETYIQEIEADSEADSRPVKDHYFLGRFQFNGGVEYQPLIEHTDAAPVEKPAHKFPFRSTPPPKAPGLTFLPRGFAQMTVVDAFEFNRNTYHFEYVRREFLGEVRCLVFDVTPVQRQQPGKFIGRIWVEDRADSIVRFNGTYVPAPTPKGAAPEMYFHFDSWRVNAGGNNWVPAQIYIEEEGALAGAQKTPRFKAQSRIWDYATAPSNKLEELTSILVEGDSPLNDQATRDNSPLESQRDWERQAEENLLARLEKGGLLAPPGAVDTVLNTVVNNLIVSAKLNIDAQCRVLLTSPIETFAVGHTIVISRGLIDVLPDEPSLALVLASELSHIALGHRTQTQFAFHNQTMLSDAELLQRFRFARPEGEMVEAGRKTIEIMKVSPYQNTANAGLFLKALAAHNRALPMLLKANMGNQVADEQGLARLSEFTDAAPPLEENKLEQIAALPLGSRIKLDPWSDRIEMVKTKPISLLSAREKMPFEVTPFVLNLARVDPPAKKPMVKSSLTEDPLTKDPLAKNAEQR